MKDSFRNSCNVLCLIIRSEKWSDQFSRHIISFPEEGGVRGGGGNIAKHQPGFLRSMACGGAGKEDT